MFKCKAALRLTRFAQTSPARRLTTSLCPLRFSADSSKVTSPGCPLSPESILQPSAPLPAYSQTEVLLTKQADKRRSGAALGLSDMKPFQPRLTSGSYIFINFRLKKTRKQPHFEKILRGWRMARGAFGRGLGKLKVPDTNVRADGALV